MIFSTAALEHAMVATNLRQEMGYNIYACVELFQALIVVSNPEMSLFYLDLDLGTIICLCDNDLHYDGFVLLLSGSRSDPVH